jgi:sugar/nucleoside kinase (ribokinase family)
LTSHRPGEAPVARPVVLVVGSASRDLVPDDPRGWRLGGAVCFCSLALARLGFRVRALIGADRVAAEAEELATLRSAGVTLAIAGLESGPVFDNVSHLLYSTSDEIPVTALPRRWTSGFDAVLFVPVAAEVGDDWASLATGDPPPLVGIGWQGLLRVLRAGEPVRPAPPRPSPLLRAATLVVFSREDVEPGTSLDNLAVLLGPSTTLVRTEGVAGGEVHAPDPTSGTGAAGRYPAIPSDQVVDPTGAGDVFLAALLAATLLPELAEPYDAARFAAAAGSLVVEGAGLEGVPDLAAVRRRLTRAPSRASR